MGLECVPPSVPTMMYIGWFWSQCLGKYAIRWMVSRRGQGLGTLHFDVPPSFDTGNRLQHHAVDHLFPVTFSETHQDWWLWATLCIKGFLIGLRSSKDGDDGPPSEGQKFHKAFWLLVSFCLVWGSLALL